MLISHYPNVNKWLSLAAPIVLTLGCKSMETKKPPHFCGGCISGPLPFPLGVTEDQLSGLVQGSNPFGHFPVFNILNS